MRDGPVPAGIPLPRLADPSTIQGFARSGKIPAPRLPGPRYRPGVSCHVFGLTGGIGSGKSTVGKRWRARKLPVIDADDLARAVVAKGTEGHAAILSAFGDAVMNEDGSIDRARLGRLVFADRDMRHQLEGITHPRIRAALEVEVRRLELRDEPLCCYEAPLLVETGRADLYRPLVVVAAPEDVQVVRALHRDAGADEEHVLARMRSQAPPAEKVSAADFVIETTGEPNDTLERADKVLDALCRKLQLDPSRYPRPPMDAA